MSIAGFPTSSDIYLEVDGTKVAVVQSYTAKAAKTSRAVEAFGEEEPVATVPGQINHVLELTRLDATDEAIRESLRAKFRRAKNTEQSRGAIRSQVILELESKLSREIITGYEHVTVSADTENPTVCLVEFSFTVAHGLNQIWLTASITI